MTSKQIDLFFLLVESHSFSRAEEQAFLSKQAIKKQLDALETELDFPLFVRSSHGLMLTAEGRLFYNGIKNIQRDLQRLIASCRYRNENAGALRIGIPDFPKILLEEYLHEFSMKHEDIPIQLVHYEPRNLVPMLKNGELDLADVLFQPLYQDPEISFLGLEKSQYYCLVAPDHPLAKKSHIQPSELTTYTVTVKEVDLRRIRKSLESHGVDLSFSVTAGKQHPSILSTCYNGGIFMTNTLSAAEIGSIKAIPVSMDSGCMYGVLYSNTHNALTETFLVFARSVSGKKNHRQSVISISG